MNVSYSDNTDCTVKLRFSKNLNLQWVRFKYEIVIKHKLYFQNTKTNFWLNNIYMCDQESIHIYKWNLRGWSTSPPQILNKKIKKKLVYQEFQHIGPEIISCTIFTMTDDHLRSRCPAVRLLWKWKLTSANWCLEIERWNGWMW